MTVAYNRISIMFYVIKV